MKPNLQYIVVLITFVMFQLSCIDNHERIVSAEVSDELRADIIRNDDVQLPKSIQFPSMKLSVGQTLTIEYTSSGCFHYEKEIVKINRTNNKYLLSYSRTSGGKLIQILSDSSIELSLTQKLNRFSSYCKRLILEDLKDTTDLKYFSTSSKDIFINDGFRSLHIPMTGLSGPFNLMTEFLIENKFPIKINGS